MIYYNEFNERTAAGLRQLIAEGLAPNGIVDTRDIRDVSPSDLDGFTQCHFFAGIGGWAHALRLADWDERRPVWTGSCPCQPFSAAGSRRGVEDERHLWPAFRWLIAKCGPAIVFGEQVAAADGREWFAGVHADLEAMGYRVGGADLCAAGVGAPHARQRLWWVADSKGIGRDFRPAQDDREADASSDSPNNAGGGVADRQGPHIAGRVVDSNGDGRNEGRLPIRPRRQKQKAPFTARTRQGGSHWGENWKRCRDGKRRRIPVEPSLFPVANGIPERVGILHGSGNAIVPENAAAFIRAYREAAND